MIRQGDSYRPLLSGVAVLVLLIQLTLGPSQVFALDLQSKADIIDLMLCYGTYTLQVEQIQGAWKVKALALKLLTFTPFFP